MATCNLTTLMNQACANGFDTLSQTDKVLTRAVRLQLLCNLSAGGGTGNSGQLKIYVNDPNAEGVKPADQTLPALAYSLNVANPLMAWNTSTLLWQ